MTTATATGARYHMAADGTWKPCGAKSERACPYGQTMPGGLGHVDAGTAERFNQKRAEILAFEQEMESTYGAGAYDKVLQRTNYAPLEPSDRQLPYDAYGYVPMDLEIKERVVTTQAQFRATALNERGERARNTVRSIVVNMGKNHLFPDAMLPKVRIEGPADGRPVLVEYKNGYTSIDVTKGVAVIDATSRSGGGVDVWNDAAATVITPAGKFTMHARDDSKLVVVPRDGARGVIYVEDRAQVTILNHHQAQHDIQIRQLTR